jgi:hypothetical protein
MSIQYPDSIVIKLSFTGYSSKGSGKSKPNDVRRWLMGLEKAPTKPLPSAITEKAEVQMEDIVPHAFSLVKAPLRSANKGAKNTAVGAIAIYLFSGPSDKFEKICGVLRDTLEQAKGMKSLSFSDYEIFVGKRWP